MSGFLTNMLISDSLVSLPRQLLEHCKVKFITIARLYLFPLGTMLGNVVTLSLSGLLCAVDLDGGGWPLIFYVFGKLKPASLFNGTQE